MAELFVLSGVQELLISGLRLQQDKMGHALPWCLALEGTPVLSMLWRPALQDPSWATSENSGWALGDGDSRDQGLHVPLLVPGMCDCSPRMVVAHERVGGGRLCMTLVCWSLLWPQFPHS